jgi:trk system potassium uptake protein TrkH
MNIKKILKILGKIMILEGILMIAPLVVSILYKEKFINILAFIVPISILVSIGLLLQILKPKRNNLYQKEGFALVALVWLVMTLFGAIPFVINKDIPNYVDAFFETISGFSTTGASIITDITKISHSSLFWRSFTHWIGGMGILVFILIFIPESNEGSSLHLLKAESSGPQVGKIVSKMKVTTRILYSIYLGMTVLEIIILMLDNPIPGYESDHLFFSFLTAFGCAGTGGFGFIPGSMELFSPFSQYVIATFLILFGVNFSLYYLILIGKIKDVLKSEELKTYFAVFWAAVGIIFFSLLSKGHDLIQVYTTEEAFRQSYFQVASIMTTAGFSTTDFGVWPVLAITVLMMLPPIIVFLLSQNSITETMSTSGIKLEGGSVYG